MSVCRSATCAIRRRIFSAATTSTPSSTVSAPTIVRPFSSTCLRQRGAEKKVRLVYDQLPQEQLGDIQDVAKTLPTRSSDAGKGLEEIYTEEQLEALREAEKAIDPRDLVTQARMRNDHWAPQTIEDFAYIDPQVDQDKAYAKLMKDITSDAFIPKVIKRLKDPRDTQELFQEAKQLNLKVEVKTFLNKLEDWCEANPAQFEEREAYVRDILHRYVTVPGTEEDNLLDEFATYNEQAEELQKKAPATEEESLEAAGMRRVAAETGFGLAELKKFRVKSLVFRRVVNQTRMGKIPSMYNLTVVGNGNGLIGIGEGKSAEMSDASRQAVLNALRNMKPIQRYENRTIFGKILKKVGGTTVEVTAKPPGFGIRCQHLIFEMCRCAGIHDLSARVGRSRNPMNTVKAFFEAITTQQLPDDIARSRGRKLVDLRKVYYDGNVY